MRIWLFALGFLAALPCSAQPAPDLADMAVTRIGDPGTSFEPDLHLH